MGIELDHLFVCTAPGALEAERLVQLGFHEGPPNQHPGQGMACRRFPFANAMIELFWVSDEREARSESTKCTLLWERWSGREHDASPFAICLRPSDPQSTGPSFPAWGYRPAYLSDPLLMYIGEVGIEEPVGVEMASTLAEMSRMALAHDFRHIDPRTARILLYEAGPRILPTYPEILSLKAQRHLESLGVEVFTNALVTSVDSDGIAVGGQEVPAGTVLWGVGVVASPAGLWLGAETDESGKIMVEPDLSVRDHPEVFAIGDTAHVVAPVRNLFGIKSRTPMLVPGVAQPAIQEGKYVADVIRRRVAGRPQPEPF